MMDIRKYLVFTAIPAVLLVLAGCGSSNSTGPKGSEFTTLVVFVVDEFGRPVPNAAVTTNPPTGQFDTDADGIAVIENIEVRLYTLYVRRPGYPTYNKNIELTAAETQETSIVVETQPPNISIHYPLSENFLSIYDIRFKGAVVDPEDGALPDSTIVWTSNIDGKIGTGSEIRLDMLTLGRHEITLEARDSDGKSNTKTIVVYLVDFHPNSYFPLPIGAEWIYQHTNKKFSIINRSGYIEQWELFNLEVTYDEAKMRTSKMGYKVKIVTQEKEYHYTIVDELEKDGNDIYVKKTKENLQVWNGNPFGAPNNELNIETKYTPRYILLENIRDLKENSSFEITTMNEVKWIYKDPFFGPREFTENFHVTTSVDVGSNELCTTSWGETFECIPVSIDQLESKRKWWLSRGVGIVKMQYNSFSWPPVAELFTTNLAAYTGSVEAGETARPAFAFEIPDTRPLNTEPVPAEEGIERMRALRKILTGMSPR